MKHKRAEVHPKDIQKLPARTQYPILAWKDAAKGIASREFKCWKCGCIVASREGYTGMTNCPRQGDQQIPYVHICSHCRYPNFSIIEHFPDTGTREEIEVRPAPPFGNSVKGLPDDIKGLYEEARNCCAVAAYRAVALCCRSIILYVAYKKGLKKGTFLQCIDFLEEEGHILKSHKSIVDKVRKMGNMAGHKIYKTSQDEAKTSIKFTEMMLRNLYEYAAEDESHSE